MPSTSKTVKSDERMIEPIARRSVANIVRSLALKGPLTCGELTSWTHSLESAVLRDLAVLTQGDFVAEVHSDCTSEATYVLNDAVLVAAATAHVDCVLGR
ncbi:hypothetical protein D6T64_04595 [Cryobacterium melibiosiphilum]|uniref:ArsR family transcriptional regulator n=1 Tax=Cryobacterium melibiosiphilum TaxID=995039 RepID=A0A3A5MMI7_9MICO|nr:hypothetical protein [Cryobacterium melibiosiphilum]RJT90205.1 hypothetical protein D6T64_04595 [Cryobacterium melibiosiphilum]